jgi:hypothetical protein
MPFGKWQDFDACVSDFKAQGKDEDSAKKICGALQAKLGKESFSWVGDIKPDEGHLIKGKAIHPCKTVHPEEWPAIRVYLEEELQKAAHTLAGMPLSLDHMFPLDGKVVAAEYEDGAIEFVGELNDPMILGWIKDGTIKHCSVDYDWGSLVRLNGDVAPKDITFQGLALLKDFWPGDPATSVEVWEALARRLKEAKMLSEQGDDEKKKTQKGKEQQDLTVDDLKMRIQQLEQQRQQLYAQADALWPELDALNQLLQAKVQAQVIAGMETYGALKGRVATLTNDKTALGEKIQNLEAEKSDLVKMLGEGVIDPSGKPKISDPVSRGRVVEMIEAVIPSRQVVYSHGLAGGFKHLVDELRNLERKIVEME